MKKAKMKLIGGTLALAAALTLTAVALAHQDGPHGFGGPPPGGPGHHGGPGGLGPLAHELNLTDAQKAQIKQIEDGFRESTKSLHEQLFKTGGGPLDGLSDTFDESAARAAAQSRAGIEVELEVAHARMMSQIYALLTAEQKAKVAELKQKFAQRQQQPPPPSDAPDGR
ncbi:MAG TPA: Spy/CpxP family protein refolding chaperone [Pyrinomonadaceae bacterium]|jgi:Spy/CpxP family protein refolding chaperone|nr:Spy/CpxP family protein refolding chaperone [Pyrinomonadaceae bacterium]